MPNSHKKKKRYPTEGEINIFSGEVVVAVAVAYKKPVLTPHLLDDPLIISGVQKLNMMAKQLEKAKAQPAVCARSRCCGISAA